MNRCSLFTLTCILIFLINGTGCHRGYQGTTKKLSTEDIQITDMSAELVKQTDELLKDSPSDLSPLMTEFNERAGRYNNACLRFGPDTLDARNAFDRLWYQTAQVDPSINEESYPKLYQRWVTIRDEYVKKIGRTLGYRMTEK
jgi:hypothetical protein